MTDPTIHSRDELFDAPRTMKQIADAAQPFDGTKTNPLRDPGPVCFVCGNNSPDAVRVEVLAWTNDSGVLDATTHTFGRNVCLDCLEHRPSCVGARLGHDICASALAWRGRQARKKRT